MLNQTISAKVDWQEQARFTHEKTWQDLWEFKLETEPVKFGTATNDLGSRLEGVYEIAPDLYSRWNTLINASGTISAILSLSGEPHVVLTCKRNSCSRPWLDELSEIQLPTLKVISERSVTGLVPIPEPLTWEFERLTVPSRQREIEWLSANTDMLYTYQGKWIAVEGEKIVAWGSDEVGVEIRARKQGIKVPFLVRVPLQDDIPFVGRGLHDNSNIR